MRVLVTGNLGYIGSVLGPMLVNRSYSVIGLDTGYYRDYKFFSSEKTVKVEQITKDLREVGEEDLAGIDAIIHLAALSDNYTAALLPELTMQINFRATVRLAKLAKNNGVRRFVFSSSQSIYGNANLPEIDEDFKPNPTKVYGKSKFFAENELIKLADHKFTVVILRPSIVAGPSPALRLDLVLNNLVASAATLGKIRIKSDGTPLRPVVHVEDASRAFVACLEAPAELVSGEAFHVGRNKDNYSIRDMATIISKLLPDSEVVYTHEHCPDPVTYRIKFDKINAVLADFFQPHWTIEDTVNQLMKTYKKRGLTYAEFLGDKYVRVDQVKELLRHRKVDERLFWR